MAQGPHLMWSTPGSLTWIAKDPPLGVRGQYRVIVLGPTVGELPRVRSVLFKLLLVACDHPGVKCWHLRTPGSGIKDAKVPSWVQ